MKRIEGILLLIVMSLMMTACGSQETSENIQANETNDTDKVYSLKLGTGNPESDPIFQGMKVLKEAVEEKTKGKLKVELYGSGSLGNDKDIMEQAKSGANVGVAIDPGRLSEMIPEMGVMGAPYLVDNFDQMEQIVNSDLFKGWEEQLAVEHNLQVLAYNWDGGAFHLATNNKPVLTPEDLKGLKVRSPQAPIWLETIEAMGASATGMDFQEVYPGLQQGVIDGGVFGISTLVAAQLYEVTSDVSLTGHMHLLQGIVIGKNWFDTLPSEYQKILIDEAVKAGEEATRIRAEDAVEFEKQLKAEGMEIHEVDTELFKDKVDIVYEKLGYKELRNQINEILAK